MEHILRVNLVSEMRDKAEDLGLGIKAFRAYGGYVITTDRQYLKLLFQNLPIGFEHCGCYLETSESLDKLSGRKLKAIQVGKKAKGELREAPIFARSQHSIQYFFLDIILDKGWIQFVAFNNCPGIFPHEVRIQGNGIEHVEII